jgi:hypothetical protein
LPVTNCLHGPNVVHELFESITELQIDARFHSDTMISGVD